MLRRYHRLNVSHWIFSNALRYKAWSIQERRIKGSTFCCTIECGPTFSARWIIQRMYYVRWKSIKMWLNCCWSQKQPTDNFHFNFKFFPPSFFIPNLFTSFFISRLFAGGKICDNIGMPLILMINQNTQKKNKERERE